MCGDKIDGTYQGHHILPRASGGNDTLENYVLLCGDCHTYGAHGGKFRDSIALNKGEFKYFNG